MQQASDRRRVEEQLRLRHHLLRHRLGRRHVLVDFLNIGTVPISNFFDKHDKSGAITVVVITAVVLAIAVRAFNSIVCPITFHVPTQTAC